MSGGGGSSGTQRVEQTNVPDWARPQFEEMLGRGIALSKAEYQPYTGQRQAAFTDLQNQAFGQAERQGVAGQLGAATGLAGLAAGQGLRAGQFQPGTFAPIGVQAPQLQQFQMGPAQRVSSQSFVQPGTAEQFMNPFMQNVVDIQKREAQRAADIAGTQRGAQAVQRGAFGGSRQAILEAEAQRNLAQQLGDIQATGSQAAFQQAQEQFNREQQARLQAQMANQQAGLTVGQQNLGALLGIQQLGAGQNLQAQTANQQALMDAQRMFEQSRQFGADLGLRGGAQALQGAQTLGQLGQQQFGQEMDIMGARERMGGIQQQQEQQRLAQQFADFQAQRDFPYQQLGFLSDLLRGTGSSTRTVYQPPQPGFAQTAAGLGTAAIGLKGLMAKGGEVQHYADGGITGLLGDRELRDQAENAEDPMLQLMARRQEEENAALRAAAPQGLPGMQPETAGNAEVVLTQKMVEALNRGDRRLAEELAEALEEIKVQQEVGGIAGMMPEQMAEGIPEGGIMEMAMGGEVQTFSDGGVSRPRWMDALEEMQTEPEETSALGRALRRGFLYSSDVEKMREEGRLPAPPAPTGIEQVVPAVDMRAGRGTGRNVAVENQLEAERVARVKAAEDAAKATPKPDQSGIMGAPGAPALPGAGRPGLLYGSFDAEAARKRGLEDITAAEAKAMGFVDAEEQRHKEFYEKLGLAGTEKEKRLRESLEGIKGEKNQAKSMALFEAGLAMLSADPSRGALAAIGSGAMKALGSYKGDLKDLEARRERMVDKLDDLDTLRRQEAIASEEGRKRIAQRREQVTTEFGKEFRLFAKQFDVDIPLEAARFSAEVALRERTARMAADRTTEAERLRAKLAEHKPGSPEYNRILKDVEAIAIAQGAGKPDTSYLRDPQYKSKVDALALVESQLAIPSVAKDPKKRQPLEDRARVLRQELETMSGGRGSSTSQSSGTVDTSNPLLGP